MDVSTILELARQNYNALNDTFFSDTEIYRLIYRAQKELAQKAFVIERKYTTPSVASTAEYSFPTNAFSVYRLEYNGMKLQRVTKREEDSVKLANQTTVVTGTPAYYSIWNSTLTLTPAPAVDGDTITMFTYNFPQEVSSSSTLEVPSTFHDAVVDYILSYMYAKDGNLAMSTYYRNVWAGSVQDAIIWKAKMKRGDSLAQVQSEDLLAGTVLGLS